MIVDSVIWLVQIQIHSNKSPMYRVNMKEFSVFDFFMCFAYFELRTALYCV